MAKEQNINTFTAGDIERYHKGLMSPKERHALEKAALDDRLLADALEGYAQVKSNVHEDLTELRGRLKERIEKTRTEPVLLRRASISWWKVAAMIVIVIGAGLLVYQLAFVRKNAGIAEDKSDAATNAVGNDSVNLSKAPTRTAESNKKIDSLSFGLVNEEKQKVERTPGLAVKEDESALVDKKKDTDADGVDEVIDKQTIKIPPSGPIPLAESNNDNASNAAPKLEEPVAKSRRSDNAPVVTEDVRYRQVESKQKSAANAAPINQGITNQFNVFRGRVTDNNNNALPFSNITNLNDNVGTYSDARGNFVLTSPDSVLNVQIRSLGFETTNAQLLPTIQENNIQLEGDNSITAQVLDTVKRNTNRPRDSHMTLEEPEPADGWNNYDVYLANNLKTPESFKAKQKSGTVELVFDVDNKGEPYNIVVKKSLCESCDKEAIRLIKEGPKWKRKFKKAGKATVTVSF
jgi:outer membrane biosynthesis protein TonB